MPCMGPLIRSAGRALGGGYWVCGDWGFAGAFCPGEDGVSAVVAGADIVRGGRFRSVGRLSELEAWGLIGK